MKTFRNISVALVLVLLALAVLLSFRPPALLRVGANYAAKIVCSNVFLAGRDTREVLLTDVQAPGIALLRLMRVSVDHEQQQVRSGFLGFIGDGLAIYQPGKGCTVVPDGNIDAARSAGTHDALDPQAAAALAATATSTTADLLWPDGTAAAPNPAVNQILADDRLAGPGARAVLVIDHGRIVAERYAAGFSATTPLLGWSMSKTVIAGLIGMLVKDGTLTLDQAALWPSGDGRERIRIADLLAMSSGLQWNEGYGSVSDVTRMLYLQGDMAAFARAKPLAHPAGTEWSYSSGTAVILSRIMQDAAAPDARAYIKARLYQRLGITTMTMEQDEHGTLVGSSYIYATARDWARYAQLLLQDGIWQGQALLPAGYVAMMATPVAASGGEYGRGQVWLWSSDAMVPGVNPDAAFNIPPDTFWMMGHDGQFIAIVRSHQLLVLRLGLTPAAQHYSAQPLLKAVLGALP